MIGNFRAKSRIKKKPPFSLRAGLGIGILLCSLVGICLSAYIAYRFAKVDQQRLSQIEKRAQIDFLEQTLLSGKQWLRLNDLIVAKQQVFLIGSSEELSFQIRKQLGLLEGFSEDKSFWNKVRGWIEEIGATVILLSESQEQKEEGPKLLLKYDSLSTNFVQALIQLSRTWKKQEENKALELRQASQFLYREIAVLFLFYLFFIGGFWWFCTKKIVSPLELLAAQAEEVRENMYQLPCLKQGPLEIQELSQSFSSLVEQLLSQTQELEGKIREVGEAKTEVEKAYSAKSRFLAQMSHELRTPLTAIIGYSEILIDEMEGSPQQLEDLECIRFSGNHLLQMINNILDCSQGEAGKLQLSYSEVDLYQELRGIWGSVEILAEKNQNQLVFDCPECIGVLMVDPMRFRQVVYNIISNACKFTKEGNISIQVKRLEKASQDWVEIKVEDTGIGMTEEQLSKIFIPFTQASEETAQKFGGTGLGLSICQQLVRAMGGEIKLSSTFGKGTSCLIQFPSKQKCSMRLEQQEVAAS